MVVKRLAKRTQKATSVPKATKSPQLTSIAPSHMPSACLWTTGSTAQVAARFLWATKARLLNKFSHNFH